MKSLYIILFISYLSAESFCVALLPNELIFDGTKKIDTIKSINSSNVDLTIFTGDSKDGSSICSDKVIGKEIKELFDSIKTPLLYALGDNEWTDCHRISNGSFDPLERLEFLRKKFFNTPYSQGGAKIKLNRMRNFPENSRVIYKGVMFVTLNIVGSNNGFIAKKKQCFKRSKRSWSDCQRINEEFKKRDKANIEWMIESLKLAKKRNLKAVAFIMQADILSPYDPSNLHSIKKLFKLKNLKKSGYAKFVIAMLNSLDIFSGKVLLIHGDTHYFRFDMPLTKIAPEYRDKLFRVESFGDESKDWVRIDIDTNKKEIFKVTPILFK